MIRIKMLLATGFTLGIASLAHSAVFDFANANSGNNSQNAGDGNWEPFIDGVTSATTSASIEIDAIEMTLTRAVVSDNGNTGDDTWAITNQGIGVLSNGDGFTGENRRIEGDKSEAVVFSFDKDVFLNSARFGNFGGSETITLTPAGGSVITLTPTNPASVGGDNVLTNFALGDTLVTAGTEITLTSPSNDFLFNEITVTVVPEPSSLALLTIGGLIIARRRR